VRPSLPRAISALIGGVTGWRTFLVASVSLAYVFFQHLRLWKKSVNLVYRDVWTNSQGRGKTSLLVRVWANREAGNRDVQHVRLRDRQFLSQNLRHPRVRPYDKEKKVSVVYGQTVLGFGKGPIRTLSCTPTHPLPPTGTNRWNSAPRLPPVPANHLELG
jgi:hypothetical protein